MAAKMLDEVLEKEKQAALREADSGVEAQKIISDAEKKALDIIRAAETEAKEKSDAMFKHAAEEAEKLLNDAGAEALQKIGELRQSADDRFSEAVGMVKEIISK